MRTADDAKRKRGDWERCTGDHSEVETCSQCLEEESPAQKQKWTRLLLRELYDLGYHDAATCLEKEAAIQLRSQAMEQFQSHVQQHEWDQALELVRDTKAIKMKSKLAIREAGLLLLKRKYIDFLLKKQLRAALQTFQQEILPVYELNEDEVKDLGVLLLCQDEKTMTKLATMPWKNNDLLARFECLVSPEEIIPEGTLRRLVKKAGVEGLNADMVLIPSSHTSHTVVGVCAEILLKHTATVLDLGFAPNGQFLASSSRDGSIFIWRLDFKEMSNDHLLQKSKFLRVLQSTDGAAECIAWSPDSSYLLCCGSGTNIIQIWNPLTGQCEHTYHHPAESVTKVQWLPNGKQFVSGTAEKSLLLWNAADGSIAYQWGGRRVLDIAVHPNGNQMFVLTSGYEIRAYDVDAKSDEILFKSHHLISSINISSTGQFLAVNLIEQEEIACIEIATETLTSTFRGLKEQRYIIRPSFGGNQCEYGLCGSEDGKVYVWRRESGKLLTTLDGHSSVVNVVVRHPIHGNIIASASDDETIRLWTLK